MVDEVKIAKAVAVLKAGGLVGFPTETVYGLGADAKNPDALNKIFIAKQRPADHPVIVHIANTSQLTDWAREIPENATKLAEAFWPGPLTLILKKAPGVLDRITGGQDTVGLRIPHHPVAEALLQAFGSGLAAPSANRFGRISPTTALAVDEELNEAVNYILEGGQCKVGVESTIVDVTGDQPVILRPGMISAKQIEDVLKKPVAKGQKNSPRVSGSMESHYSPTTELQLIASDELGAFVDSIALIDLPLVIMSHSQAPMKIVGVEWVIMPNDPEQYAHDLYYVLREMDKKGAKRIVIESVFEGAEWDAVRDRLSRASYRELQERQ